MNTFGQDIPNSSLRKPSLGIIGGSGMCTFHELKLVSSMRPKTEYGVPSDDISICEHSGQLIAFLPRHAAKHTLAPHRVPYKANIAALKEVGVQYIIGTCIAGSLKKEIVPGSLVLPDQFVNLTWGRDDTDKAHDGSFIHLPMGEPYCAHLREEILKTALAARIHVVRQGTVAVIQGPRFSTAAESHWLSANGWDLVNMTQYPECYFARELGICYAAVAAVTDYDVGLHEKLTIEPDRMDPILNIFRENIKTTKKLMLAFIEHTAAELSCSCASQVLKTYYESQ